MAASELGKGSEHNKDSDKSSGIEKSSPNQFSSESNKLFKETPNKNIPTEKATEQKELFNLHPGGYEFMRPNLGIPRELSKQEGDEARTSFTNMTSHWHNQYPHAIEYGQNTDGDPLTTLYLHDKNNSELIGFFRHLSAEGDVRQDHISLEKLPKGTVAERYVYKRDSEEVGGDNTVSRRDNEDVIGEVKANLESLLHIQEGKFSEFPPVEEFLPEGEVDMSAFGNPYEDVVDAEEIKNFNTFIKEKQEKGDLKAITREDAWRLYGFEI